MPTATGMKMPSVYWNLLRIRLRQQVSLDKRQRWTDTDLAKWLVTFAQDPAVREKNEPLPTLDDVKVICADLMGSDAVE
jgi:hypothetical protein